MKKPSRILVTGGAGYVGAVLVPRLLGAGYLVTVIDLYLFGKSSLAACAADPRLTQLKGDIRDQHLMRHGLKGIDAVIHLASISNDPSVDLDPELSQSVNLASLEPLLQLSIAEGARRFIFASSASVYGISDSPRVAEDHALVPVSEYNRLKVACERVLFEYQSPKFTTVSIRPGTLHGASARQRLDLTVNLFTAQALLQGYITVFGGSQQRPCLHIEDMVDLYCLALIAPDDTVAGQIFNAGCENLSVAEIAQVVQRVVGEEMPQCSPIEIRTTFSDDPRSYRICSDKLNNVLRFRPRRTVAEGVRGLIAAFSKGRIPNALTDENYYNVKRLKSFHASLQRGEVLAG